MVILDAHLHMWDPAVLDYNWLDGDLNRRFGPIDLKTAEDLDEPVERIFVQADCLPHQAQDEVRWVESIASQVGVIGIVAHAPLERGPEGVASTLADLEARELVVGVRRLLQSEAPGFAATENFRSAARSVAAHGLVFDACVRPAQLREVIELADDVPELSIVLDHLGKPEIAAMPDSSWLTAIAALADRPSVTVKLSGLPAGIGTRWHASQMEPYLDACLAAFGPDRLIYGGDWPVSQPLSQWRVAVAQWAHERMGAAGVDAVMGANARRIYRV